MSLQFIDGSLSYVHVLPCRSGAKLEDTLEQLKQRQLRMPECLPYDDKKAFQAGLESQNLCQGPCASTNKYVSQGTFTYGRVSDVWQAQKYIRLYGAIVTSFDILDDFIPFFKQFDNSKKVYTPRQGAKLSEAHAVVLVGYNNDQGYWIAQNSWGPNWGDGGYFRVSPGWGGG